MRQVEEFGDIRNQGFCVHCGGLNETNDHMPSKVFLDKPYPENLPVSPACAKCNEGFSRDEEYLACLLECVIAGEVNPDGIGRESISRKLRNQPALAARLAAARRLDGETVAWDAETDRVRSVLVKLARGHAAFELNEPQLDAPLSVRFAPLTSLTPDQRDAFEQEQVAPAIWPEVGSRAMSRLMVVGDEVFEEGWLLVQEDRYRYRVLQDDGLRVKIVIREYLAAEVQWK
ncbi:hypothetical protein [Caulobacter sp. S45]|uniref:hypothetical protein n=1 Tax=Caulobacter sp. S45 TaxID=1641861 RepID=UPI0015760796|nr:hypothetical protein [Caulobacter sp. S45]